MRISDWSSDVCSSDLPSSSNSWLPQSATECTVSASIALEPVKNAATPLAQASAKLAPSAKKIARVESPLPAIERVLYSSKPRCWGFAGQCATRVPNTRSSRRQGFREEENTSELQSL